MDAIILIGACSILAMVETSALYSLLIAFLTLYANPFWNYAVEMAAK